VSRLRQSLPRRATPPDRSTPSGCSAVVVRAELAVGMSAPYEGIKEEMQGVVLALCGEEHHPPPSPKECPLFGDIWLMSIIAAAPHPACDGGLPKCARRAARAAMTSTVKSAHPRPHKATPRGDRRASPLGAGGCPRRWRRTCGKSGSYRRELGTARSTGHEDRGI